MQGPVPTTTEPTLTEVLRALQEPFWHHWDFWITVALGLLGVGFSLAAFIQAGRAKDAAEEAGGIVKLQTVAVELAEISHKIDRINPDISYKDARDLLNEVQRRLRRVLAPYAKDDEVSELVTRVHELLDATGASLKKVRPADLNEEANSTRTVYYGIEGDFGTLNGVVADLLGLFEKRTI